MKISKEVRRTSRQLFKACLNNGSLDESRVRQVVAKIVEARPRSSVAILSSFFALVKAEIDRQRALVESATTLSPEIQDQLQKSLSSKYGRPLTLEYQVRPELLGGIRVRVGSDVWDGSVKARLEALKASLS
ncbi:MAG: F0F1 ATP synthase subunit delta [Prosthecobacter sp.]|jgi:F-type H+-transporting ATPase subunit delta|nr:F0F1 ATP synthase subunit delta [Prosthecobacter sp.]